jgi:hypothetical protein
MIETIQSMITFSNDNSSKGGELGAGIIINPAIKRHFELEIKTLQSAPRDADKLERLLKIKERQNEEEAMYMEDTQQRLVTEEIEMHKVVLHLMMRNKRRQGHSTTIIGQSPFESHEGAAAATFHNAPKE